MEKVYHYIYETEDKVVPPMKCIRLDVRYNKNAGHSKVECKTWMVM